MKKIIFAAALIAASIGTPTFARAISTQGQLGQQGQQGQTGRLPERPHLPMPHYPIWN